MCSSSSTTTKGRSGLVLNRPSETSVGDAVPQLETLLDPQERLFIGGPVQPSSVIVLAEFEDATDAALIAFDDVGVLGTGPSPDELTAGVRSGRAFLGHAGWGPGQLDGELERGDWILEPAQARGRLLGRPEGTVARGADPQGWQLRPGGAHAGRPVDELDGPGA